MDQQLDQGFLQRQFLDAWALRESVALHVQRRPADAGVLRLDAVVQPAVFEHAEQVKNHAAVFKQRQEAANVGVDTHGATGALPGFYRRGSVGIEQLEVLGSGRAQRLDARLDRFFHLETAVVKHVGRADKVELETAEFQMGNLVGGHHLEPGEVLRLVVVVVDHRRQIDLGPVGGSGVLIDPADLPTDQFRGAEHLDVLAGQSPGVEGA